MVCVCVSLGSWPNPPQNFNNTWARTPRRQKLAQVGCLASVGLLLLPFSPSSLPSPFSPSSLPLSFLPSSLSHLSSPSFIRSLTQQSEAPVMSTASKLQCLPREEDGLSPRRRRTLRRGLVHSPHAATACSTVTTCRGTVRNKAVFRTVSTQTRTGISTSFSTMQLVGDASRPRPAPRNHARPATKGTSTSFNECCNCGISTVFSTIVNCGIGLSSHDGHLENQHDLHAGKSTTLSTYCNRTNSGMSKAAQASTTCTTRTATTLSTHCARRTAETSTTSPGTAPGLCPGTYFEARRAPWMDVTVYLASSLLYTGQARDPPAPTGLCGRAGHHSRLGFSPRIARSEPTPRPGVGVAG